MMRVAVMILVALAAVNAVTMSSSAADHAACNSYCTTIMKNCPTTNSSLVQYKSMLNCTNYCFEVIILEANVDKSSNVAGTDTFTCRNYHAGLAGTLGPIPHCSHAGPSGGNTCGSPCQAYCDAMMGVCSTTGLTTDGLLTYASCMSACGDIPYSTPANSSVVFAYDATGEPSADNLLCRLYHGATNGFIQPVPHCSHASLSGGGLCGSYCNVYCRMVGQYCGSSLPPALNTSATCNSWCSAYYTANNTGSVGDTTGDSVNCRIHYAIQSKANPTTNCPSALGLTGSNCPLKTSAPPSKTPSPTSPPSPTPAAAGTLLVSFVLIGAAVSAALF